MTFYLPSCAGMAGGRVLKREAKVSLGAMVIMPFSGDQLIKNWLQNCVAKLLMVVRALRKVS